MYVFFSSSFLFMSSNIDLGILSPQYRYPPDIQEAIYDVTITILFSFFMIVVCIDQELP